MTNENSTEADPHPGGAQRFVGRTVSFEYVGTPGAAPRQLCGVVSAARYLGRTVRGELPDYEISVRGKTGRTVTVSLVDSRATFPE